LAGATNQGYPRQLLYVNNLYPNNILLQSYHIRNPSMSVPANANLATHGLPNNNEVPSYNNEAGQMHSQMTQLAGQSISATNFYPQPSIASQLPQREKKPALLQDPKTLEILSLESKENSDSTASNNQAKASNKVEETTLVVMIKLILIQYLLMFVNIIIFKSFFALFLFKPFIRRKPYLQSNQEILHVKNL